MFLEIIMYDSDPLELSRNKLYLSPNIRLRYVKEEDRRLKNKQGKVK